MILDQAEGAEWVSRRNPVVRKAHDTRPQDEQDFAAALPVLDAAQRRWLADALETTYGPHPWLGRLWILACSASVSMNAPVSGSGAARV